MSFRYEMIQYRPRTNRERVVFLKHEYELYTTKYECKLIAVNTDL